LKNRLTIATLAAAFVFALTVPAFSDETKHQADVEHRSEQVMPFDMNAAMHSFAPTKTGGIQTIMVHSGDPKQIALVRSHLRKEADAFAHGDFTDPASIHGGSMPGMQAMHEGSARIHVRYAEVASGASITYTSNDPALISAIHEWFKAQVTDHGAHATMKM
jgi:hypothetical protein